MDIFGAARLPGRFRLEPGEGSMVKQSFKDETDINKIMARFIKTGAVEHGNKFTGDYGFATSETYHESMNLVSKADSVFAGLPAELRARFDNDPGTFFDYVQNPQNYEEMADLGFSEPEAAQAGSPAPAAPEPPAGEIVAPATSEAAVAAAEASD